MSEEDTEILSTKKLVLQSIRESDRALTEKVFEVLQQRADEMAKLEAKVVQLEEALRYIAEFDAKMKMHPPTRDAPMNVTTYAFALGAVQGRAWAALSREASEQEG